MIVQHNIYPASLREKRAIQFIKEKKYKEARNHLKAALKERPSPLALKNLLELETKEENLNHAINYYNQIAQIYPEFINHKWLTNIANSLIEKITKRTKHNGVKKFNNKKIKIAVIGAIWKRPNLTKIFLTHLDRMFNEPLLRNINYRAFLAVSEEMWLTNTIKKTFPNCDFIETDNFPLSYKWQSALDKAKLWTPDMILIMGSDNFISHHLLLRLVQPIINGEHHFSGLGDCAMVDNDEVIRWRGYNNTNQPHRSGEPIGASRIISSQLLDEIDWSLWSAEPINKGLDSLVMKKLENMGYLYADTNYIFKQQEIEIKKLKILTNTKYTETVVDIKTSVNVTKSDDTITNENFEPWNSSIADFLIASTGNTITSKEIVSYLNHNKE